MSDRASISLIAGRPHVTSSPKGFNLYGDSEVGFYTCDSFTEFLQTVEILRQTGPEELSLKGMEGFKWAQNRLSHRQAARFMMAQIEEKIPRLDLFPWNSL
jgi:hypothetical protein